MEDKVIFKLGSRSSCVDASFQRGPLWVGSSGVQNGDLVAVTSLRHEHPMALFWRPVDPENIPKPLQNTRKSYGPTVRGETRVRIVGWCWTQAREIYGSSLKWAEVTIV